MLGFEAATLAIKEGIKIRRDHWSELDLYYVWDKKLDRFYTSDGERVSAGLQYFHKSDWTEYVEPVKGKPIEKLNQVKCPSCQEDLALFVIDWGLEK